MQEPSFQHKLKLLRDDVEKALFLPGTSERAPDWKMDKSYAYHDRY